ncbi:MAG: hypothetical protein HYV52_02035 [Parcubacteria group bacterium]|nr:hypothetical protein [Parcubacteria group bacterium]
MKKIIIVVIFLVFFVNLAQAVELTYPSVGQGITTPAGATSDLGNYLAYVYTLGLGASGIAALAMIVWSGIKYMTSEIVTSKEEARKDIQAALFGLALLLGAYLILNTINPNLVSLTNPELERPAAVQGYCGTSGQKQSEFTPPSCCSGYQSDNEGICRYVGLTEGSACPATITNGVNCSSDQVCSNNKCKVKASFNETCSDVKNSSDCLSGLTCISTGIIGGNCHKPTGQRVESEYCGDNINSCGSGLKCSAGICVVSTSTTAKTTNEACTSGPECQSNRCEYPDSRSTSRTCQP